jgi:hypothetical protein
VWKISGLGLFCPLFWLFFEDPSAAVAAEKVLFAIILKGNRQTFVHLNSANWIHGHI